MQIPCNTLGAHHVKHVVCHAVQRDGSAIKSNRAEVAFISALFDWLKPLTDEGGGSGGRCGGRGEETRVPGENP